MFFAYTGVANGEKVNALIESASLREASTQLRSQGVMVIEIKPAKAGADGGVRPRTRLERFLTRYMVRSSEIEAADKLAAAANEVDPNGFKVATLAADVGDVSTADKAVALVHRLPAGCLE